MSAVGESHTISCHEGTKGK